jgi:rhodanese-related sulfurtransferase
MKWFMRKFLWMGILAIFLQACAPSTVIMKMTHQQAIDAMTQDASIVLVDVRTPQEYASGYVEGAINIPLDTIEDNFENIIASKDTRLFIICRSGNRSAEAAQILKKLGYTNITDIGGVINWPQPLVQP